jgi:hypothetical protein
MLKPFAALVLAICAAACHRNSSTEKILIGSWNFNHTIDSDETITFEPDHTFSVSIDGFDSRVSIDSWGTWRVEGKDIVRDITYPEYPPYDEFAELRAFQAQRPRHVRETIVELSPNTFKVKIPWKSDWAFVSYTRGERPRKPDI